MKLLNQRLSSPFGQREHPIYHKLEFHTGIDLIDDFGFNVYNTYNGIIRRSRLGYFGEGNYIQIRSDINEIIFYHNYFHNENNFVKEGDYIQENQLIAKQGMTGTATGIHTHYEIFIMDFQLEKEFAKKCIQFVKNEKIGHRIFFDPFILQKFFEKEKYYD